MICKNGNIAPLPTFSVLSKYRVPTMQNRFEKFEAFFLPRNHYITRDFSP